MGKREFSLCVCVCVFISHQPTWKVPNLETMHAVPASSGTSVGSQPSLVKGGRYTKSWH